MQKLRRFTEWLQDIQHFTEIRTLDGNTVAQKLDISTIPIVGSIHRARLASRIQGSSRSNLRERAHRAESHGRRPERVLAWRLQYLGAP